MKNIAILTSGGDSPGMNAAISAVVRASLHHKLKVVGILNGFEGLIDGRFIELNASSVSNIIQRGGTILKSSRSKRFLEQSYRKIAFDRLKEKKIDGLIVLGGDGTFKGASVFSKECDFPIIGIPCTIDNDLFGTDFCIGYDTAINTAMDAIDKIRDTAESHSRLFFVEVMGRDAGLIALRSGIAGGAEAILIPETKMNIEELVGLLKKDRMLNYSSMIVVVAEGDEEGGAFNVSEKVKKQLPDLDTRITALGHIQRGGKPSCMDRILATRMGLAAVEGLINGQKNTMVGIINNEVKFLLLENSTKQSLNQNQELLNVLEILTSF
jgi:6-phosphofructokinase 1